MSNLHEGQLVLEDLYIDLFIFIKIVVMSYCLYLNSGYGEWIDLLKSGIGTWCVTLLSGILQNILRKNYKIIKILQKKSQNFHRKSEFA